MASTWSDLKFELIGTGEQSGTWGTTTNDNLGIAIQQAIGGRADVTMSSTTITLTLTDTTALQNARALYLNLTGTPGGAATLNVPAVQKAYIVYNNTTGGFAVTVKVSGQTGVSVPSGKSMLLYDNGTDVVDAITHLSSLTLGSALPLGSGGTGAALTDPNADRILFWDDSATSVAFLEAGSGLSISGTTLSATFATPLAVVGDATGGAEIRLPEDTDNGSNYVAIKAPNAVTSNRTVNLPDADTNVPIASQQLTFSGPTAARTYTLPDATTSLGYINIPQSGSAKTTAYILATSDVGEFIEVGSGGSIEIPNSTFSAGDAVLVFNNTAAGITITCTITTAYIGGTDSDKATMTLATRGIASILFVSGTVCVVTGNVS
jgi:hypothetical protein